jgi:putative redox protein
MADISVRYQEGDRFTVRVRGHTLTVDQPLASAGEDAGPTPTELFVAGLAACVGFYAERFLHRHAIATEGLRVECDFTMSQDRPARVSGIDLQVFTPARFPASRREALLRVVEHCTVHNSLRQAPTVRTTLVAEERVA